jgi:peptidoglycan/LPS O-acetylase OafA/YrhL
LCTNRRIGNAQGKKRAYGLAVQSDAESNCGGHENPVSAASSRDRFQQLDALRAVAIAVVMLHHYINPPILVSGFGVTFMFVLSGYFATTTLLKLRTQMADGRTDMGGAVKDFYIRRYLRIGPMYFLVLLVTALCNVEGARDSLPWNAFFLANVQTVVTGEWNGRFAPLWSLSFLEQFYLIWPFIILMLPRRRLVPILLCVAAVGPAWRFICYWQDLSGINWCVSPLASCDAVGLGALLAVAKMKGVGEDVLPRLISAARWIGLPGYIALLFAKGAHHQPWYTEVIIPFLASLTFVWLADKASRGFSGVAGAIFDSPFLAQIGRMSYSIFLLHTFTELLLPHSGVLGRILDSNYRCLVLIPASILLANVSWYWIERPIMELRRRMPRPTLPAITPDEATVAAEA